MMNPTKILVLVLCITNLLLLQAVVLHEPMFRKIALAQLFVTDYNLLVDTPISPCKQ